jgi:hypothetical protein
MPFSLKARNDKGFTAISMSHKTRLGQGLQAKHSNKIGCVFIGFSLSCMPCMRFMISICYEWQISFWVIFGSWKIPSGINELDKGCACQFLHGLPDKAA